MSKGPGFKSCSLFMCITSVNVGHLVFIGKLTLMRSLLAYSKILAPKQKNIA